MPPLSKTPLLLLGILVALTLPTRADTGVDVHFTTPGTILPRRGHEVLTLQSTNVERLSAAILHIPEADTLHFLTHPEDAVPAEATEVWHSQIEIKLTPAPGQAVTSTLDALQLVGQLQPGFYIATAHELTTGTPRTARKLFMISNIGLEAFTGADGLAVQARLLSEANPAAGIDIALIAHNNREIARAHTDNDGIVRFTKDQISGHGEDMPAALYAYGADGEFTALQVTMPKLTSGTHARAMILTDYGAYKPGEHIHGLVLVRNDDGTAASGWPVYAQLENETGGVAEFHTATAGDSGGFPLNFHAPDFGKWYIRAYRNMDNHPILLGETRIDVGETIPDDEAEKPSDTYPITIAPGRRSFQPGEIANVSVQPAQDSLVTVTLTDQAVHDIVREKIGKDGAPVQLAVPKDATGGMYVIATAFTPPKEAHDNTPAMPLHRSFGIQWIDIDQGAKRMSVRIDTPERVLIGGKLPTAITLQDTGDKPGKVQLIGSSTDLPVSFDPLAFFYGRRPLSITIADSYASIIGSSDAAVPDFSAIAQPVKTDTNAVLWPTPVNAKGGKADFDMIYPPTLNYKDSRLRLSALAWSDDRLGYAEATVIGLDPAQVGHKPEKKIKPIAILPVQSRAALLRPGQSVTLKPREAIIASIDPIVATPLVFDNNKPLFVTSDMPQFRDYMQRLLVPANDETLLYDAILSFALPGQAVDLPHVTNTRMLDAIEDRLTKSALTDDQKMMAHYVLLKGGRETKLEVAAWLGSNPKLIGIVAKAARVALSAESPLFKTDAISLDATTKDDNGARAIALCLLAEINQPWPAKLVQGATGQSLALQLAQAAHMGFGGAKLKFAGTDQTGNAIAVATKAENADTRPLHVAIIANLPQ